MGTEVFDRIRKGKTPINVPLTNIKVRVAVQHHFFLKYQ